MGENVRVAVRVRPFNEREKTKKAKLCIEMKGSSTYITDPSEPASAEPKKFAFDHSYWSHDGFKEKPNGYLAPEDPKYADQQQVFNDLGEGVLLNAWNGYNCSLFAYGQTGSGKSYSMVGYGVNKGIVPITCERLFEDIDSKKSEGSETEYQVSVSMLEIYNEQVRDLLNSSTLKIKGGMKVRQHPKMGFYVVDLLSVPVGSYTDIDSQISQGTKNRTVASTNMNATSSRAHTIVAINFSQKGKNELTGQNTTKTSVINLVDLAGSERADSTGATGDRLKEGSAINQSLSTLGNVIKALADASNGNKKVMVPFRDSVLTKLLKNALGGNSKTIMIAALSPADINFDETLSTLRFADRAKAIKTTAVVNESPTEKLIRELREENARLLEKLKAASGDPAAMARVMDEHAGMGSPEPSEKEDGMRTEAEVEEMKKEMEERLRKNQEEVEQMKLSWEERLKEVSEASKMKEQELRQEHEMKKTIAHLWNLNEDPQLTNMVTHFLKPGSYRFGNRKSNPPADIILNGLSIQEDHARIDHDGESNVITLYPGPKARTVVNGVALVDVSELHHGDRVMFGNNHLFVLHHPNDAELLQKQEEAKTEGKAFEEPPATYEKAQEEIARNSVLAGLGLFDTHNLGDKKFKLDVLLREDLLKLLPMINEANAMSEELDKKVSFEPVLISPQSRGETDGKTEVFVKMKNLKNEVEWIWEKNKFVNRKYIMQEIYQNFVDGYADWQVSQESDPFWEPVDADILIGTVHLFLQSLAYKIELEETLAITDYRGGEQGYLDVEVIPCTDVGAALEEDDFVEDPSELIGGELNCKVKITAGRGLPKKFSKGESYCKYKLYLEKLETYTSKIKNTINPDYKHEKIFKFQTITKCFVEYLLKSPLIIEVWGKQSGEVNPNAKDLSTKQLMNQDKVIVARAQSTMDLNAVDPDRYRLLCEINVYKRRTERMEKKLKRIQDLVKKQKAEKESSVNVSDLEAALIGPDSENQRFHAVAKVVLETEKVGEITSVNGGEIPSSKACCIQ